MRKTLYILCLLMAVASCARMGQPDGGWFDEDPPRIIGCTPEERATNVTSKKITIEFDEFIKVANATQNVIVSPAQLETPEIKTRGKKIVVELLDSLIPNTTYTIDFSDAITDNNEDNPLGNYTYTFSTGERIDTFEVSGYVLNAENLEPIQGISVGLYAELEDSVFRTKPMLRISRTDGNGHFVIKGVAPGEYRCYALQDADADYKFSQKSEIIAYSHETYKPWAGPDTRQDTIWRDSLHIANIERVPYTHFYPDDIVLLAFQETQTDRYLLKTERKEPDRFSIYFSYGNEQLPIIRGLNFEADSAFILEASEKKDTLTYWLRDTTLVNQDTLTFSMEYLITDSLGQLISQTDTIEALAKTPYAKRLKERQKEIETWEKEQKKKKERELPYDSIMPPKALEVKYNTSSSMDPDKEILIEVPSPVLEVDTSMVHLYSQIDSLWYRAPFTFQRKDSTLRQYVLHADWHPDTEYSLEIDSAAFVDIYGLASKEHKEGIKVPSLDEYATLSMEISGISDTTLIVQLVDKSDKVLKQSRLSKDGTADFFYIKPGTYYVRAFNDRNGDGKWSTGNYDEDRQAEEVYYYRREIECKAKWDITQQWNVNERKRNEQKPSVLVKQKEQKQKKKLKNRNEERARQLGIEYVKRAASSINK